MKFKLIGFSVVSAALVAPGLPVAAPSAQVSNVPVVHGSMMRDHARITFEWPVPVFFTVKANGKQVSITFDRKARPDFKQLLQQLSPYVISAERKPDGKTVVLTLNKAYRIRTFVSDTINGIDLLKVDGKPAAKPKDAMVAEAKRFAALAPAAGEPVEAKQETLSVGTPPAEPAPEKPAEPAEATVPQVVTPPLEKSLAPAIPVAPAEAAVEKPVEKPAVTPAPAPAKAEAPAEPKITLPPATAEVGDGQAIGAPQQEATVDKSGKLRVNLSAGNDNAVLRFPFAERTAMAVFARSHTLWIVFNRPLPVDLVDFEPMPRTVIGKPEVVASKTHTILRMQMEDTVFISTAKEEESYDWAVLLTPQKRPLANALVAAVNTDPPVPPHVFIPSLEIADPVIITDPLIGDEMVVTPLFNVGEGIAQTREFVEFSLLATAQGVAVNKKSDDVSVVQLRNGLRISLPNGATLTPGLPKAELETQAGASQSIVTLFPHEQWKAEDPKKMSAQVSDLFQRIVGAETSQESNEARLRMAQLYLSEGMAVEALAYIDGINRTNPSFYRSNKVSAMRGAANFLMYRFPDAARDFAAAELNNNKEIDYWRSMLSDLLGSADQIYDYLALNQDYISKYPPVLRQRLAIVSADRSIAAKEYNTALKIFDTMESGNQLDPIHAYINFLLAKISLETGQEKEALEMWDKLAEDYDHPFVRSRAEFSRTVWNMNKGNITKEQAIENFERLRLAWHGDSLELNIATLLGDLYVEQKDYINAMRIWHGIVTGFPNTSYAQEMSRRMQEAFITLFNSDSNLSTMDALAIYNDYRNYAPPGIAGDEIVSRLADKLVSLDLLEQAIVLLDRQMRSQAEKEHRSEIGAKLASIYLMNHQPAKALQALQDSVYGENSLLLRLQRNRITAEAMVVQGQSDKALETLGQDTSPEAERIRISVYWAEKDWAKLTASIEALLKEREDVAAPITIDESEYLLKLALAYIFQDDTVQLQYLHDYFDPLMVNNPNKSVFNFITSGDIRLTTTNFDDLLKYFADTKTFITTYQAEIKSAGIEPVPAATAKP